MRLLKLGRPLLAVLVLAALPVPAPAPACTAAVAACREGVTLGGGQIVPEGGHNDRCVFTSYAVFLALFPRPTR